MTKAISTILFSIFFLWLLPFSSFSQRKVTEEVIGTPYVGIQYGGHWTGGSFAERYGFTNSIGAMAGYKTKKNWVYALDGNFFFGNRVDIDGVLDNVRDAQGQITNTSGGPAIVLLFNRGFNTNGSVGKLFPVLNPNPNSGIILHLSAGYFWNRLRIETQEDEVPQLQGDYLKGYDRLEIGFNTGQFLGYSFMANRGFYNFYAGFYAQQMFTTDQRDIYWDHPTEEVNKDLRIGFLYGFRVGWLVPIYKRQPKEFYYN